MARAAEKKAAEKTAEIISFWKPILVIINSLYMIIRMYKLDGNIISMDPLVSKTKKVIDIIGVFCTLVLQYYSYLGIIEDGINPKRDKKQLIGGAHLDILAYAIVIQYCTLLLSIKFYYLLLVLPIWGCWYIYKTFFRKTNPINNNNNNTNTDDATATTTTTTTTTTNDSSDKLKQRQQQRSDKRRQKWS